MSTKPTGYPTIPTGLWNRFYEVTQTPRPSKKEDKMVVYLERTAKEKGLKYKKDAVSNVVIYLPGTKGRETEEAIIIQSHMDMVCDKTPDHKFDFDLQPIELVVNNGWISANKTTLGADNGFGVAAALALIDHTAELSHPPLELLFTVDEETGLHGAKNIDVSLLSGKRLINIDTEEWGSLYVGCAGGIDYEMKSSFPLESVSSHLHSYVLCVNGFQGGHSGIDIHKGRASAIKMLGRALWRFTSINNSNLQIASLDGGRAHNIIPRDASCEIFLNPGAEKSAQEALVTLKKELTSYLNERDLNFTITLKKVDIETRAHSQRDSRKLVRLLVQFSHGAHGYYWNFEAPLVKLSNNFAQFKLSKGALYLQSSLRFFDELEAKILEERLQALAESFDLEWREVSRYCSWKPEFDGPFMKLASEVYEKEYNEKLKIKAIHAGLECGIIKAALDKKLGKLEAISIGPNIKGAHSPTESLEIESSNKFWEFFTKILEKA